MGEVFVKTDRVWSESVSSGIEKVKRIGTVPVVSWYHGPSLQFVDLSFICNIRSNITRRGGRKSFGASLIMTVDQNSS